MLMFPRTERFITVCITKGTISTNPQKNQQETVEIDVKKLTSRHKNLNDHFKALVVSVLFCRFKIIKKRICEQQPL